jgi:hypothetical protein
MVGSIFYDADNGGNIRVKDIWHTGEVIAQQALNYAPYKANFPDKINQYKTQNHC